MKKYYTLHGEIDCENYMEVRLQKEDGDDVYLGCFGKYHRCGWEDGVYNKSVAAIAFMLGMKIDDMLDALSTGKTFKLEVETYL